MWKYLSASLICAVALNGCTSTQPEKPKLSKKSGIDLSIMDSSVRPQDDFYLYAAGTWDKNTEIPADKVIFSSSSDIGDRMTLAVQDIVKGLSAKQDLTKGSPEQKVADFYNAYMDEAAIELAGTEVLQADWKAIAAIRSKTELQQQFAQLYKKGITLPVDFGVFGDRKNPRINALYMVQSGLGLPDREYYLNDSERNKNIRTAYQAYLEKMLGYAGMNNVKQRAASIVALETKLAEHNWTQVDSRNTDKNYNNMPITSLPSLAPGFKWIQFLDAIDYSASPNLIVYQPSYMTGFAALVASESLDTWKNYLSARLIINSAAHMNAEVYATHFDFFSRTIYGAEAPRPRWKRAISSLNGRMGELVGKVFIKQYFPPEAKVKMDGLVANLLKAMDQRLTNLSWMSEDTKLEAHDKLNKISSQIGYPSKWRDYSSLEIGSSSLLSNVWASNRFEHAKSAYDIGKPVDKELWWYPPQTVNASYSPTENRIVFPAGYLQAPHFQIDADDAANYGAIGATIGHEIGHGFDDQGSKNDGDGVLRNWWTSEDREKFDARTKKLVTQFNQFCPFDDACLNGELSLGENIGDLAGIIIAYDAYQLSLNGKAAPVIDGLSGDERFILSFAQAGKGKWRDEFVRTLILTDPHVPDIYRILGPLQNFDVFYDTYQVKEGDKMYIAPEKRVNIW